MRLRELVERLQEVERKHGPNIRVIVSRDPEGNGFAPVEDIGDGYWNAKMEEFVSTENADDPDGTPTAISACGQANEARSQRIRAFLPRLARPDGREQVDALGVRQSRDGVRGSPDREGSATLPSVERLDSGR